jgi:hypothetical protein
VSAAAAESSSIDSAAGPAVQDSRLPGHAEKGEAGMTPDDETADAVAIVLRASIAIVKQWLQEGCDASVTQRLQIALIAQFAEFTCDSYDKEVPPK